MLHARRAVSLHPFGLGRQVVSLNCQAASTISSGNTPFEMVGAIRRARKPVDNDAGDFAFGVPLSAHFPVVMRHESHLEWRGNSGG